jgi:hypothetical protein
MTIFQKSVEQTTREYKITTVVVSLITYLIALLSIIAVNWVAHSKPHILQWRKSGHENAPVKTNLDAAPEPTQPAGPVPTSQESKTGDTEKKAGSSGEHQDIERASNGAGKPDRFWPWRQK